MHFSDQSAIVTGASEGIGLAIARAFVEAGCRITIIGRSPQKMESALAELPAAAERLRYILGDLRQDGTQAALIHAAQQAFGPPHILVNNVGGGSDHLKIESIDDDSFWSVVKLNLGTAFSLCRAVAPEMAARRYGRIVNVTSVAGRERARLSGPDYSAAKAGLIGLTRHLAWELGPFGVTVNAVAPGIIRTERAMRKWESRTLEEQQAILAGIPVGRMGEPHEVAMAVLYLASADAGYTNGVCLDINGGSWMC
jgi:3-oxoacyl-[acyl-carrier protein] reductase